MVAQIEARIAERLQLVPQTEVECQMNIWQGFYDFINERSGLQLIVPPLDRTEDEIKELDARGRMLVYVHPEVSTTESLPMLFKALPQVKRMGYPLKNIVEQHGWIDVEKSIETPNQGLAGTEIKQRFEQEGVEPQTINTYLIASQFSKYINGEYFDPYYYKDRISHGGHAFIFGTRSLKYPAYAYYDSEDQKIDTSRYSLSLDKPNENFGARSAGRKKIVGEAQIEAKEPLEQTAEISVEALLDGLGIEDGIERLEVTLGVLGALERNGIENAGTGTMIPEALARQIASGILATRTIQEVAIPDDDEEAADEGPDDAELALIESENRRSTVFTRGDIFQGPDAVSTTRAEQAGVLDIPIQESIPSQSGSEQPDDGQRFTTKDIVEELFPNKATVSQRASANLIAKNRGWDPKNLTASQRVDVRNELKIQYRV